MMGMSPNVDIETKSGGLKGGLKSMLSGESFFTNTFRSSGGRGEVLLGAQLPGDIATLDVSASSGWNVARGAFIACADTVATEPKFGGLKGMLSGASLAHLEARGEGSLIVGAYGAMEPYDIDGTFIVDDGHIVAWSDSLTYNLSKAGSGWIASFLSGEGYVCTFTGKGRIWIQTRNATAFGQTIGAMMSPVGGGGSKSGIGAVVDLLD